MKRSSLLSTMAILTAGLSLAAGCRSQEPAKAKSAAKTTATKVSAPAHDNVLVVINKNSKDSIEVGEYYAKKRNIPAKNVLRVDCTTQEGMLEWGEFDSGLFKPIRAYLLKPENKTRIDYIVLTKGVPLGMKSARSVDSLIAAILQIEKGLPRKDNPFFNSEERFSSKKFGYYLVTRLDGYDVAQAKRLVDLALKAQPRKGLFLFDASPMSDTSSYAQMNVAMAEASKQLKERGFECRLDTGAEFVGWQKDLMGYFSWGSNDKFYSLGKYTSNSFAPGALAETAVSTSARTFRKTTGGQSLIVDLIEAGVTGVKGYHAEPGLAAIAMPNILFDRYTRGWTLAESFYAASRYLIWRDVVVGDPLCAPYSGK